MRKSLLRVFAALLLLSEYHWYQVLARPTKMQVSPIQTFELRKSFIRSSFLIFLDAVSSQATQNASTLLLSSNDLTVIIGETKNISLNLA